jgi:HlyD family secretion protein
VEKKRIITAVSLVAVLTVLYFAWGFFDELKNKDRISASGTIEATEIQVSSRIPGKIESLKADEGDNVSKEAVLAVIDAQDISSQYEESKAAFEFAASEYDRMDSLYKQAMASRQQYDSARNRLAQTKAAFSAAKDRLENVQIKSPVTGTVLVKAVEEGEVVSVGSTVMTVADLTALELKVYIPENRIGKINLGQAALITVDSFPGEKFKGKVKYISNKAEFTPKNIQTREERVNQVFEVKIKIPNPDMKLKPGMPADAEIDVRD